MRPPSSSKNPKKNSDEDWSRKKKKIKSKSTKRRRDPSISSYSSSESEPDSRSRRKISKSKKKLEKRSKESKKSEKRSSSSHRRKKKRYHRDSSVSCSTCSDSERSRSPVRKSKSRKRDRKSARLYESSRSKYRSPSCSTCSERSRSRSRSPIEERFGSSRGRSPSPIEERFGEEGETRRLRSVLAVTKTSDEDEDKIIKAYDDYPSSRSKESYDEGDKKRNLVVGDKEEDLYDNQPVKDTDVGGEGSLVCESGSSMKKETEVVGEDGGKEAEDLELLLRQKALENFRKFRGGRPSNRESLSNKNETSKVESHQVSQNLVKTSESRPPSSLDDQGQVQRRANPNEVKARSGVNIPIEKNAGNKVRSLSNDSGGFRPVASSITSPNTPNHLKRVRESSNKILAEETSLAKDKKDETSKSYQGSQSFVKTSESKPPISLDDQRQVQGGATLNELKARSVINMPTQKNVGNMVHSLSNDIGGFEPVASSITSPKTPNQLKRVRESSNKIPAEETLLAKDNQNKKVVAQRGSDKVSRDEVDTADRTTSGALNAENQNCKSSEPGVDSASGSQFEQKTFSRMRDGEMVQVSYKVYIPKKTPALARRQLQR